MSVGSRAMLERVTARLRGVYGGRPWLVATDVVPAATELVGALRALGAERCVAICAIRGVGPAPDAADAELHLLGVPGAADVMTFLRAAERALGAVPPEVAAAVDAADRYGRLRTVGNIFSSGQAVAGRAAWGARPAAWRALEDKAVIDALWDAAGVRRAPSEVVPVDAAAVAGALGRLDRGAGVVVAGDATEGFHGGAALTRRVRDAGEAAVVAQAFAPTCRTARVMPFLDGLPCSVAGVVLPDGVLALRPSELVVLRRPDGRFLYAGVASTWDPPAALEAELRQVAVRTGEHLRAAVGYRGTFVVDGVATPDGFLPTELNPRVGASLGPAFAPFPFYLAHLALVEGLDVVVDGAAFEAALRDRAAERRYARGLVLVDRVLPPGEHPLRWEVDGFVAAGPRTPDAVVRVGPSATGAALLVELDGARTPKGPPAAGRMRAALAWADARLDLGLGPLDAAG